MGECHPNSHNKPQYHGQPVDGLALWESEADRGRPPALSAVRLDGNERLLIPFTTTLVRAHLHYLDYTSFRGYVHCNGPDCILCRIGRQQDVRDLWPVYDVLGRTVGVLPVSDTMRPHALRPQLMPVFRGLKENAQRVILAVRRLEAGQFVVHTQALLEGGHDGAAEIAAFHKDFEAGRFDLASVFPRVANQDLAGMPEVGLILKMKGLDAK
jgi:hypothetical protein